jgi:predicted phosphodiesterase
MQKIKRGIVASDFHAPYQHKPAIKLLKKFMDDFKPDEFIMNGDMLNYAAYSAHGKRKNEVSNESVQKDHVEAIITLDTLLTDTKIKTKVWIDGNHDAWQDQYLIENPDFADEKIHRYERMQLEKRGFIKPIPYKKAYKSGKLYFTHGWRAGTQSVRQHLISDYKTNFVMGHIHKSDTATSSNIKGNIIQGYSIGCMCKLDFKYALHPTANHGFGVYYMLPNGTFTFYNIVIINDKFMFEGQEYSV